MSDLSEFLLNKLDKLDEKLDSIKDQQVKTEVALNLHEERYRLIQEDLNSMSTHLNTQCKLLADYNSSLREHIRRTELLENKVNPIHEEYEEKEVLAKVRRKKWTRIAAVLTVIGVLVGIAVGISQLTGVIK